MEIHIIGNVDYKKKRLNLLLAEHYPQFKIINQEDVSALKENDSQKNIALLVIILTNRNVGIVEQLLGFQALHTPILFVEEEDTDLREEYLSRDIVKGYIRRNAPLEKIKNVMNLVLKGGTYKEPTPTIEPARENGSEEDLLVDWTILSMNSKGFGIADVSEVVKLPAETVSEKLKKIKNEVIF